MRPLYEGRRNIGANKTANDILNASQYRLARDIHEIRTVTTQIGLKSKLFMPLSG